MSGWIRLSREITDWEWYGDTNVCRVFVHLLLKANYKPSRYQGHEIPAGSLVCGVESLAAQTGLTGSQVRTVFKKLLGKEITIKSTNKFSIITITKWSDYQTNDKQISDKSQTDNKPISTSKEGKKERISSKEDIRPADVSESVWNDWLKARKAKRSGYPTKTTIEGIRREAEGIGWSMEQALRKCAERTWISFEAKWITGENNETNRAGSRKPNQKSVDEHLADAISEINAEFAGRPAGTGSDSADHQPLLENHGFVRPES